MSRRSNLNIAEKKRKFLIDILMGRYYVDQMPDESGIRFGIDSPKEARNILERLEQEYDICLDNRLTRGNGGETLFALTNEEFRIVADINDLKSENPRYKAQNVHNNGGLDRSGIAIDRRHLRGSVEKFKVTFGNRGLDIENDCKAQQYESDSSRLCEESFRGVNHAEQQDWRSNRGNIQHVDDLSLIHVSEDQKRMSDDLKPNTRARNNASLLTEHVSRRSDRDEIIRSDVLEAIHMLEENTATTILSDFFNHKNDLLDGLMNIDHINTDGDHAKIAITLNPSVPDDQRKALLTSVARAINETTSGDTDPRVEEGHKSNDLLIDEDTFFEVRDIGHMTHEAPFDTGDDKERGPEFPILSAYQKIEDNNITLNIACLRIRSDELDLTDEIDPTLGGIKSKLSKIGVEAEVAHQPGYNSCLTIKGINNANINKTFIKLKDAGFQNDMLDQIRESLLENSLFKSNPAWIEFNRLFKPDSGVDHTAENMSSGAPDSRYFQDATDDSFSFK